LATKSSLLLVAALLAAVAVTATSVRADALHGFHTEPRSMILLGIGLISLGALARRKLSA